MKVHRAYIHGVAVFISYCTRVLKALAFVSQLHAKAKNFAGVYLHCYTRNTRHIWLCMAAFVNGSNARPTEQSYFYFTALCLRNRNEHQ